MAITVKHKFVSAIPDGTDTTIVRPSNWNDTHELTGLGTMAEQDANNVAITGGTISGVAVTGYVPTTRTITAGTGLTGGGDLSANRTIALANTAVTAGTYGSDSRSITQVVDAQGRLTSIFDQPIAIAYTAVSGLGTAATKDAGAALGVATLDAGGKVPASQIPLQGDLNYQGTWNATTNTPTLTSSVGTKGYYYVVDVAGTTNLNGITDWQIGDWAIFNGSVWQKVDNTDAVTSVNGLVGTVVLTTTNIAEGTNEYFTQARARASLSAGTAISYDNSTGVITNSAPDQTVSLTGGTGISTSGTYPNFTITNTSPSLGGDVVGPASATDNAIARFDTTTGKLLQNSVVTIGDTGATTGITTLSASTSVTTPIVQATNSAGLALRNSAGTTQMSMGAGGGDNMSINVSTNLNGTNAQIDISPTGTGHVHIKPTGTGAVEIAPTNAGTMNNMVIGGTTPLAGSFTDLSVTGTTSFDGSQGTAGQVLTSAGTGNTPTWATPATGTVTSVGLSAPSIFTVGGSPVTGSGTLDLTYSGTALPLANGGTGATTAPYAMANLMGFTTTVTSATPVVLTNTSSYYQLFTGSGTQIVRLPVTSTLQQGWSYHIVNNSTSTVQVQTSGTNTLISLTSGLTAMCTCIATGGTGVADWEAGFTDFSTATGAGAVVLGTGATIGTATLTSPTATGVLTFSGTATSASNFHTTQTSGVMTIGGSSGTGTMTIGRSTVSQQTDIQAGATASGSTKTMNIGTGGLAGSTTNIAIGSATIGAVTNIEVDGVFNVGSGIVCNSNTIADNYIIPTGSSGSSVGPMTVASGKTVTISSGSRWVVL
jgi:hypothetical protein